MFLAESLMQKSGQQHEINAQSIYFKMYHKNQMLFCRYEKSTDFVIMITISINAIYEVH